MVMERDEISYQISLIEEFIFKGEGPACYSQSFVNIDLISTLTLCRYQVILH